MIVVSLSAIGFVACSAAPSEESTETGREALALPPIGTPARPDPLPPGCVYVAATWAEVQPPCPQPVSEPPFGSGKEALECWGEWGWWAKLQSAGCTTPHEIIYESDAGTDSWAFDVSCPVEAPNGLASNLNLLSGETQSVPGACPIFPNPPADSQQVLWNTYVPGTMPTPSPPLPGGCVGVACMR